MKKDEYIGILTSGGDASGMNAAIRAVTRAAIFNGFKVKGIYRGYEGLIAGEVKELTTEDVSSIIQRGGTILKTARSETFITPEGRKKAYEIIQKENINALIIIGGDGSLTGARIFAEEYDVTCIGLPGTIDNDLYGTDFTIGYDTALNTIVECVDKIRDTATSHDRIFFVEVMGRDAGFLAQNSAIASGAEAAIIPEDRTDVDHEARNHLPHRAGDAGGGPGDLWGPLRQGHEQCGGGEGPGGRGAGRHHRGLPGADGEDRRRGDRRAGDPPPAPAVPEHCAASALRLLRGPAKGLRHRQAEKPGQVGNGGITDMGTAGPHSREARLFLDYMKMPE